MVDFECVHCGNIISMDLDTVAIIVKCPNCNKKVAVFVLNKKLITTDYDIDYIMEILSKKEVR